MSAPLLTLTDLGVLTALLTAPQGLNLGLVGDVHGAAPVQIAQCVRRLRDLGCEIEQAGVNDVRLTRTSLAVWAEYLEHRLADCRPPREVWVYRTLPSTQDLVRHRPDSRLVAVADEQTAGRGRLGRRWISPPGSAVLFSLAHPLVAGDDSPDRVQCIAAVAVAEALEGLTDRKPIYIKWPNDLVADGRKLSGILVETMTTPDRRRLAIIGVGVNVEPVGEDDAQFPREIRDKMTHLRSLGCRYDRLHVAAALIGGLLRHLNDPIPGVLDEWRQRNLMRNQRARFRCEGKVVVGEVVDLDADAGLVVRTDDGLLMHLPAATTTVEETGR